MSRLTTLLTTAALLIAAPVAAQELDPAETTQLEVRRIEQVGAPELTVRLALEVNGRTFVFSGEEADEPDADELDYEETVMGHWFEFSEGSELEQPLTFTLVGEGGSCVATATHEVAAGVRRGEHWRDPDAPLQRAWEVSGCQTGSGWSQRYAMSGATPDARWQSWSMARLLDHEVRAFSPDTRPYWGERVGAVVEERVERALPEQTWGFTEWEWYPAADTAGRIQADEPPVCNRASGLRVHRDGEDLGSFDGHRLAGVIEAEGRTLLVLDEVEDEVRIIALEDQALTTLSVQRWPLDARSCS